MASSTSTLLSIGGLFVGAYGVYYLYTNGYFEKILGAIKLPTGGGEEKPAGEAPASKCKTGELEDSKGKCVKCATSLEKDKCVKAKMASVGYVAAYHGWRPHDHRMTVA
jgi:hypothetical protein